MRIRRLLAASLLATAPVTGHSQVVPPAAPSVARDSVPAINRNELFTAIGVLAADSMEGRRAGTPGGARARAYLIRELTRIGVQPLVAGFTYKFSAPSQFPEDAPVPYGNGSGGVVRRKGPVVHRWIDGTDVLGIVRGTERQGRIIVVSAHYDHLGMARGEIWNGADDNASGSAGILAIAEWVVRHPPKNSIIFAWFDGEEEGLLGSEAFVARPPVPLDSIVADVNLDMVSRNTRGELFAVGAYRWPVMAPFIDSVAALHLVNIRQGHDGRPDEEDYTFRSDMGPFHKNHIPFVHFGVEEHADYHMPTDRVERILPEFYYGAVVTAADFIRRIDASLDIVEAARRHR